LLPLSTVSAVSAASFTPTPYLPPLLRFDNGSAVTSAAAWHASRRDEVKTLLMDTLLGTIPSTPPPLTRAVRLNTTVVGTGVSCSFFNLTFDTRSGGGIEAALTFPIEVIHPTTTSPEAKAYPLFMTQWNHREWALNAVTRGYIGCIYPGADARDVSPQWQAAYPKESMALIMTRAFVGSRTLDFLLQPSKYLPSKGPHGHGLPAVRAGEVAVSGHSRNGKQTLIFAAFDDRVTAAVGSSPGAPIASPYGEQREPERGG
jgi:hypothetical protein